ncbi:MAG: amidohydrolase [Ignavibacteriae bacterium]|nr:MAG: amidohydrolase [Ignavibacteriota bacterium]
MPIQIKWFLLFVLTGAVIILLMSRYMPERADTIYRNCRIYTMDAQCTVAEAMAVERGKIVGIGTTEYIQRKFQAERMIDLEGRTVLPGLIDAHCHLFGLGLARMTVDVSGSRTEKEAAEKIVERVAAIRPAQWVRGRGWDQNLWPGKSFPTQDLLNKCAPENPVCLVRIDGHACWVNKRALEIAGVSRQTPDPPGGRIIRDALGDPTGVFIDAAMELIYSVIPEPNDGEMREAVRRAIHECTSVGLTSVQEMGVDAKQIELYKKIIDENNFPLRVYAVIDGSDELWDRMKKEGVLIGYGDNRLTLRALKLYVDGALGSRGAALIDPYSDDPGNRGLTVLSEEILQKLVDESMDAGFQVCTHAIGDRANHIILDVYESALNKHHTVSSRLRIEHAQVLSPEDIPRFKKLGILPSMQPTHCTSDMYWAEARLGPKRIRGAYAWRSLLNTGVIIPSGSDFPVENPNPFYGIYAACTRQDKNGVPRNSSDREKYFQPVANVQTESAAFQDGWYASEKMTREEAVRGFTIWAAYAAFEENLKGSLERGKLADFIVISKDIFTCPVHEIRTISVESTVIGGNEVFPHH